MLTGYFFKNQCWGTSLLFINVFLFSACVKETHVFIPVPSSNQAQDTSFLDMSDGESRDIEESFSPDLGDTQTGTGDIDLDLGIPEDVQQDAVEEVDMGSSDISEEEVDLPDLPPLGGPFAFITNSQSNTVSVFDVTSREEISVIDVGISPEGVAIHPDQDRVFVANNGLNGAGDSISVIDVRTLSVVHTITGLSGPEGIVIHPDGDLMYVANPGEHTLPPDGEDDRVMVIDLESYEIIHEITVRDHPWGLDISPDGTRLYVANAHGCGEMRLSCISVVDTESNEVISEHQMAPLVGDYSNDGDVPPEDLHIAGVRVTQDGERLIVVLMHIDLILVLDIETMEPVENGFFDVWIHPHAIDLSPDGRYLYAPCWIGDMFWVIDLEQMLIVHSAPQSGGPRGVSATPDGAEVWVTSQNSDEIRVYDTADWQIIDRLEVSGEYPYSFGHFMTR
jgi:YVTN family beta-propeller protein